MLRDTASRCQLPRVKTKDEVLQKLLEEKRNLIHENIAECRALSKRIWRRRRFLKRAALTKELEAAAAAGRAPQSQRPSIHLNWAKVVGKSGKAPTELLTDYFGDF